MGETQNTELNCVDLDSSRSQKPTVNHNWQQTDRWFWPIVFLGALPAMHFGWSLEDIFVVGMTTGGATPAKSLHPQLFSGVITGTAILLTLIYFAYSPNKWLRRLLNTIAGAVLLVSSTLLGVGLLRHDYTFETLHQFLKSHVSDANTAISFVDWHHVLLLFLFVLLGSFWLNSLFGTIKLFRSPNDNENSEVDRQHAVPKWLWYTSIGVLIIAWLLSQIGSLVSVETFLPSVISGLAIAFVLYFTLWLFAVTATLPAGKWIAWLVSLSLGLAGFIVSVSFGDSFSRVLQIPTKYSQIFSWSVATVSVTFTIWFTVLFLTGRLPRKLRNNLDKAEQPYIRPKPTSLWRKSNLVMGCLLCLTLAHSVPYCYDLPIAFAGKGTGRNQAKLVSELRQLGNLLCNRHTDKEAARFQLPSILNAPATVFVSRSELESDAWNTMIRKWQKENRLPILSTTDTVQTLDHLKLLENSPHPLSIDGKHISSKSLNLQIAMMMTVPRALERELKNTHVDQDWIEYFTQNTNCLTLTNCTFDPDISLSNLDFSATRQIIYRGRLNDQQLEILQRLANGIQLQFGKISDIQLSPRTFESLITQSDINFESGPDNPDRDSLLREIELQFSSLNYPRRLINSAKNQLQTYQYRGSIRFQKAVYGESISFPPNENNPSFETDSDGRLVRFTQFPNDHLRIGDVWPRPIRLNAKWFSQIQVLEIHSNFLISFCISPFQLQGLQELRFNRKQGIYPLDRLSCLRASKFLDYTDQARLRELELPFLLEELLPHCQPWPQMETLAVVLRSPPSQQSLEQIRTATNLKQLVIYSPQFTDFSAEAIENQRKLWTDSLVEAKIDVPTTLVWKLDQLTTTEITRQEESPATNLSPVDLDIGNSKSNR